MPAARRLYRIRGGYSAKSGDRSIIEVNSIIATHGDTHTLERNRERYTPPLNNRTLFKRDANLCMYCGLHFRAAELTRDHITPISRGGSDVWTNVVTACRRCNNHKGGRTARGGAAPARRRAVHADLCRIHLSERPPRARGSDGVSADALPAFEPAARAACVTRSPRSIASRADRRPLRAFLEEIELRSFGRRERRRRLRAIRERSAGSGGQPFRLQILEARLQIVAAKAQARAQCVSCNPNVRPCPVSRCQRCGASPEATAVNPSACQKRLDASSSFAGKLTSKNSPQTATLCESQSPGGNVRASMSTTSCPPGSLKPTQLNSLSRRCSCVTSTPSRRSGRT